MKIFLIIVYVKMLTNTRHIIEDIHLLESFERKYKRCFLVKSYELHHLLSIYDRFAVQGGNNLQRKYYCGPSTIDMTLKQHIEESLPLVFNILTLGNGKISLCGLSIIDLLNDEISSIKLYFHSCTALEADELFSRIIKLINGGFAYIREDNVIIFCSHGINVIIDTNIYKDREQLLQNIGKSPIRHGYDPIVGYFGTIPGIISLALGIYPLYPEFTCQELIDYSNSNINIIYNGPIIEGKGLFSIDMYDYTGKMYFTLRTSTGFYSKLRITNATRIKFTLFVERIYQYINPKDRFGKDYKTTTIGISNDRYAIFASIAKFYNINDDIFRLLCCCWYDAEVLDTKIRLLNNRYH